MDDAERRFRACVDRFKRDLTTIIFRSIDKMVLDEERTAARQAASSSKAARRSARPSANGRGHGSVSKDATHAQARAESTNGAGTELELELSALRPAKKPKPARVRADSILGAELAQAIDVATGSAGDAVASDGNGDVGSLGVMESEGVAAARFRPSSRPPSERPLFVHRRARDGQIHALRRVRDAASPVEKVAGSGPADPVR